MPYTDENAEARAKLLAELAIEYSALFVPQSVSRNRGDTQPTLNWLVTLKRKGVELTTNYTQGIAYVPGYAEIRALRHQADVQAASKAVREAAETGTYPRIHANTARVISRSKLPAPTLEAVLYSLVSDADAYSQTFEEWAGNCGYDTDSRKAHAAYTQASQSGLVLVRLVGGNPVLTQLADLYSGY